MRLSPIAVPILSAVAVVVTLAADARVGVGALVAVLAINGLAYAGPRVLGRRRGE